MGVPGKAPAWSALFLVGYLASLLLIRAGHGVGYQHYRTLGQLLSERPLALALFFGQAAVVLGGLLRARRPLGGLLTRLGPRRLALVAAVFILTSATLSRDPATYLGELLLASLVQLVQLGNILLIAGSLSEATLASFGGLLGRVLGPPRGEQPEPGAPDRLVWGLALGVTLLATALAVFVYQRHPHVPDEVVYLYHARYFAAGQLAMPLPPVPEAFSVNLMMYQPARWFSPVPPGWPAILAVGSFFGVPWLVNPLLGGVNVVLAHSFMREIYPRRTARIAAVLLAASPWHLFMAMNFMTHTATLSCALAAALAVARLRRDPRLRWAVLGGGCIGLVSLIRPLDGLTVALLLGFWSLAARGKRVRLFPSAALTLATMLVASLVFPYNRALTGSARSFPLMQYTDALYGPGTNALGFGANRGLGWPGMDPFPGHGPIDVAVNSNINLYLTNVELLGWATGSFLVLSLFLAAGKLRRPDWQMLAVIGLVGGLHALYWFSGGPDFGARYWYLIILPCLALTARGLESLEAIAAARAAGAGHRVMAGGLALIAAALLVFLPWRAVDKYFHYRGMRPEARRVAAAPRFANGIILVRGRGFPDYASATVYNPIDPTSGQPLFAWDHGPALRRALARSYAGRPFWILNGPTVSGAGFEIVAGPLSAAELLARPDSLAAAP